MSVNPSNSTRPDSLCEVQHVRQDFTLPRGNALRVLDDISLSIYPNEVVALLGPSGCGKSTILRILAGLIRPTSGDVFVHGREMSGLNPNVAMVFQSFALYPWMTVTDNVEAVLKAAGVRKDDIARRAGDAIRLVGLAGFEEAYPRELSGGMKQRVGMARALSLDPEMLFMDEPFSQVDALTAESMRAEILDIWMAKDRNPSSILMVSHDIKEVVYMADRIVVLGANPGRVRTIVENKLPRPRDYNSPAVLRLVDQLHDIITGSELPDVPETPGVIEADLYEPIPFVAPTEVTGLLEYLDARGGKGDIFRIAAETNREFGELITVVKAAEILDFVDTPRRSVILDAAGQRFVKVSPEERKNVWRDELLKLRLFRELHASLRSSESLRLSRRRVEEMIASALPHENPERTFESVVSWARYGDLFAYDELSQAFSLEEEPTPDEPSVPGVRILEILDVESFDPALRGRDSNEVVAELAEILASRSGGLVGADVLRQRMLDRERECTTSLGEGVAVPHARAEEVERTIAVLGRHPTGVPFGAADGKPVRLFFALLTPASQPNVHLRIMARITRLIRDEPTRLRLLAAGDRDEIATAIRECEVGS